VIKTWITKNKNAEDVEHSSMAQSVGGSAGESIVSTTALGGLLSIVSAATLNHGSFVVSATALSVVASATLLGSSRGVVSASSDGHCECDGGGDEENKEINGG